MTYLEVLEKWAIYSKYDRNQTSFNLLSNNYVLHKIGKLIEMLLSEYDDTGMLAVIYARIQFENLLRNTKIAAWDILTEPLMLYEDKEMYMLFNDPIVTEAENEFIGKLNKIYLNITNGRLIGEDAGNRKQILESIERVVESINKCNVDLFAKRGRIGNVKTVSTKLHIFDTLAECLLNIEKAKDGLYFCFIRAGNSADCFFAFFLKSNGTILSVNDRIDEAYIGQHGNSRNGNWTEGKVDSIFPYDYMFKYSERDYKGYATRYEIDEENRDLYNLGVEVFMPIIIAMLLIVLKYSNKDNQLPIHYIDSFLPAIQEKIESHELMVIKESSIVCRHNDIDLHLDNEKILSGDYAEEFNRRNDRDYKETGSFTNSNQIMVDLWAEGFVFDGSAVLATKNVSCLIEKGSKDYVPEYVGTVERMRLQIYKEARIQLAEYINDRIYEAWVDYGRTEAVKEWYKKALLDNKEFLYRFLVNYEDAIEKGEEQPIRPGWIKSGKINVYITKGETYPSGSYVAEDSIINCEREKAREWKWFCSVNNCICNTWFVVKPRSWKDIEYLTGKECPKIIKGWLANGHRTIGNPLLESTDAVESVKTPFEYGEQGHNNRYYHSYYDFGFAFGFSKSGWNKIKKGIKQRN